MYKASLLYMLILELVEICSSFITPSVLKSLKFFESLKNKHIAIKDI